MQYCNRCEEAILYLPEELADGICVACAALDNNNNEKDQEALANGRIRSLSFDANNRGKNFLREREGFVEEQKRLNVVDLDEVDEDDLKEVLIDPAELDKLMEEQE